MAFAIGIGVVLLFMILFYRLAGFIADVALMAYTVMLLGLLYLMDATLTLPGVAGIILTIGMAVDANVLIFERIKEELKTGKPLGNAINEGFSRAWPSIRDGNYTTLITCFILTQFLTGSIKGFAITLALGVLVSMFSAIVVTRNLLRLLIIINLKLADKLWLFGANIGRTGEK